MDYKEEVVNEYLERSPISCNGRGNGYEFLKSRAEIENLLLTKFVNKGYDLERVSSLIKICEKGVSSYIKGFYSWSRVNKEELRKSIMNSINNSPQQDLV